MARTQSACVLSSKVEISSTTVQARSIHYAKLALRELRWSGVGDDEILLRFTVPHIIADASFEAAQIEDYGHIQAPARAVKAEMKRLLTQ
jgi:hypothetical protein